MLKIFVVSIVIMAFIFVVVCVRELRFFKITRYPLCVPKLGDLKSSKKIMILADLHNKEYGAGNQVLLDAVRKENPDLILIPGDMIVSKGIGKRQNAIDFVTQLPDICPVFYSLGNHEQRVKEEVERYDEAAYVDYRQCLINAGVHVLENEKQEWMLDQLNISIHGLELPLSTYKKGRRHCITPYDIETCVGQADRNVFTILLAHNPAFFKSYKQWGADLTVSGHLHGGIIRIPGLGGLISPQLNLFPKYSGELSVEEEQAIAVSKGLGTHTFNIRFCNYAEVVMIDLIPYKQ